MRCGEEKRRLRELVEDRNWHTVAWLSDLTLIVRGSRPKGRVLCLSGRDEVVLTTQAKALRVAVHS